MHTQQDLQNFHYGLQNKMSYYDVNAQSFFNDTVSVSMVSLYSEFLRLLPGNSRILDVGCGSGRDSKAFKNMGFQVVAIEPSPALASLAEEYIGQHVVVSSIQQFNSTQRFDGIWACASLLHISYSDLPSVFSQLSELLENNGVIYCSFKYGDCETVRGERKFTDLNEKLLADSLPSTLRVLKLWLTEDLRPNREDKWLNVILVRQYS